MPLLILGGTTTDIILPNVPRLPAWPSHTEFTATNLVLLRTPPIVTLGGNGANAAYIATRCGARVTLHTQLGDDPFGTLARTWLESVHCRVVSTPRATAGTPLNVTAANTRRQRATFFYSAAPLPAVTRFATPAPSHLLICGWPHPPLPAIARTLRAAQRRHIVTVLDIGPLLGRLPSLVALRPVFAALDLFLANEHELLRLTRTRTLPAAFAKLRRTFAGDIVVKRGADGALWLPASASPTSPPYHTPGHRVRPHNTIGAGDTFNGALLAALDRALDYPTALRLACATAASVVRSARGVLGVVPPRAFK